MGPSLSLTLAFAVVSVVAAVVDPLWLRVGRGYWQFTPMLRRLRLSPRLRDRGSLEEFLTRLGPLWGCPIEWRRSRHGIEFHGRGLVNQWLGAGRIVDLDGEGWLSVEIPFRQAFLLPCACANAFLVGPLGWPVAAGLALSVVTAFLVQRTFARRVELVARLLVMKPEAREAMLRVAALRARARAGGR